MLHFIIRALATFRIALLITEEDGPFNAMRRLRLSVYDWAELDWTNRGWVEEGIVCLWCVSFWVGLFVSTITGRSPLYGLALSSLAMVIHKQFFIEEED